MSKHEIKVCMGSSCYARGNESNLNILEKLIKEKNLDAQVELYGTNCIANCGKGPNIKVDGVEYNGVDEEKINEILSDLS